MFNNNINNINNYSNKNSNSNDAQMQNINANNNINNNKNSNNDEKFLELKELFSFYDKDKDDLIDIPTLEKMMLCLGIRLNENKKELEIIKNKFCVVKDTKILIGFEKCLEYIKTRANILELEDEVIECFKSINKTGSGKISFAEMKQALLDMGENFSDEEIQEIFQWIDPNENGGITYDEFLNLLATKN